MRTWSEKNGRADITVYGFTTLDNIIVIAGGIIVMIVAGLVVFGLS